MSYVGNKPAQTTIPADDAVTTAMLKDDAVTSAKIDDLTIVNADINASAAIANSKMASDTTSASNIATGTLGTARMGSGSASSSTFLRGDGSWQEVSGGSSWQAVTTGATLTAVAGNGYPINTTAQACTVTLPASASVGDTIEFVDYAGTWDTNNVTLDPQTLNLKGATTNLILAYEREGARLVYVDATQGWVIVTAANETNPAMTSFSATGGTKVASPFVGAAWAAVVVEIRVKFAGVSTVKESVV